MANKGKQFKYNDIQVFENLIAKYFADCLAEERPITMSGLAYALGFTDRNALYSYAKRPDYDFHIKRALLRIEQAYEERLSTNNCTGAIFALKNRGWKDTNTIEDITDRKPEIVTINWVGASAG